MPRLISAPLGIQYSLFNNDERMTREYNSLSQSDEDPVGQWLKIAKARGETSESDQVLLTLLVELHRKIDDLGAYIKDEKTEYIKLDEQVEIESIGFENFKIASHALSVGQRYYGRILMPVFPKREVPLFFEAIEKNLAQIKRLHERDRTDWNSYVTARERVMIRELKARRDGN